MASGSSLKHYQDQGFYLKLLLDFHTIDRQLYRRLTLQLGLDPHTSKNIIAFWFLLERIGFRNFVKRTEKISTTLFLELVREAIKCLTFLCPLPAPLNSEVGELPFTSLFVGTDANGLSVFISLNKDKSVMEISKFMNDLGCTIFNDIDREASIWTKEAKEPQAWISDDPSQKDRTLFVTFSKGHPITREQLLEFFTRKYGLNCVEEIHMSSGQQPMQPCLYARVIVQSTSYVKEILGDKGLVQFSVNGKDIRVRRFVSKTAEQQPQTAPCASLNQVSRSPSP